MPIRHADRGRSRKYSDEDVARMEEMSKTMSHAEIGRIFGVSRSVIEKQMNEYGEPKDTVYKPRVLRKWPRHTNFRPDNIEVRF
jgi:hypothetical protein